MIDNPNLYSLYEYEIFEAIKEFLKLEDDQH